MDGSGSPSDPTTEPIVEFVPSGRPLVHSGGVNMFYRRFVAGELQQCRTTDISKTRSEHKQCHDGKQ